MSAIIGAGPAGLTAAYVLGKAGVSVAAYEAGSRVGGMAQSFHLWGQTVDLGPHRFFSRDRRVNELWLEVVGKDYAMVQRLTRILYQNQFFHYPLQARDALAKLGWSEAARCMASYARERLLPTVQSGTFESWVTGRFGRRLFEIFFQTYSEKLWGIPCTELDADFAAQRIKQFSLGAAIKSALSRNGSEHRTLVDEFAYPTGGTGMVYERMAERITANGGQVLLNTPVRRVLTQGNQVTGLELGSGEVRECNQVISTMPLTQLVERLPDTPAPVLAAARQLQFRNTIIVYLEIASPSVCPDQWIYVHSPELRTGRITNFRNWVPQLHGDRPNTILALEYWCDDAAGAATSLWTSDEAALITLARRELLATKLVSEAGQILTGHVRRIPRCYPVYRRGYQEQVRVVRDYLRQIRGLQVIGRYGSFKYNNQDHSILMGLLAAENVLKQAGHDLWSVNADYDTYQEGWKISETGLQPE